MKLHLVRHGESLANEADRAGLPPPPDQDALSESGGGKVMLRTYRQQNNVSIEIADNGPGLKDPSRVFDPFYTTKPVGKGTGLGLSATYGIIQDHQGQITCHNRLQGGATFLILLPALGEAAPDPNESVRMAARD